jgi:hypothetical protein
MREVLASGIQSHPIGRQPKRALAHAVHEWISAPRDGVSITISSRSLELWLKDNVNRWFPPPKPKVDAKQLSSEVVSC